MSAETSVGENPAIGEATAEKLARLRELVAGLGSVLVAYSGGVDSALIDVNESLQLSGSFCLSTKQTDQVIAYPIASTTHALTDRSQSLHPDLLARTRDMGGSAGTQDFAAAIVAAMG